MLAPPVPPKLDATCAGMPLTPPEFDAVTEADAAFWYELIRGLLIVRPDPSPERARVIDRLGRLLQNYELDHPNGSLIDETLPGRYVRVPNGNRRRADRVVWCGLGREPDEAADVPTIVVEVVSPARRDRVRDYEVKRSEYRAAGVRDYWILDRVGPRLTVVTQTDEAVFEAGDAYESPLLPGLSFRPRDVFPAPARHAEAAAAEAGG